MDLANMVPFRLLRSLLRTLTTLFFACGEPTRETDCGRVTIRPQSVIRQRRWLTAAMTNERVLVWFLRIHPAPGP